jgi:HK97 gp10 family phage protein
MTVRNASRLIGKLNALPMKARGGIGKALAVSVMELDAIAKQRISGGTRSGRVYKRRSVAHTASAPGEYPKSDTGQLVASLFFKVAPDNLRAWFGTKLNYGKYLEYGTSRMKARPWLRPTFRALEGKISERVARAVKQAMGGV